MKILFLTRLFWPHVGGVEKHVNSLSSSLSTRGYNFTVLTTKYDSSLKSREKRDGVEIVRFRQPKIRFIGLLYTWLWMLKNIDLINESEIIHANDVFIWYLPFRFLFPRKPVYTTFHGWEGKYPIPFKSISQKKIAAKLSTKTLAVGEYIGKYYGIKPDLVTYGGVDIIQSSPASPSEAGRAKYKIQNDKSIHSASSGLMLSKVEASKFNIIYVGRLEEDTGLPIFLDAFKRYRRIDDGNKLKIEFIGDGKMRKDCEKNGRVYGFVDPAFHFAHASICFASGYLTILEAFANKCIVICAYDNPLKRDYYQLTPFRKWIISSNSSSDIADTIADFSNNRAKYQKMIEEGYNWVKTQTWEKVTNSYLKLWGKGTIL